MSEFRYPGSELDLFAGVTNWKSYWAEQIRPYLRGDVLEVGAGIGANTAFLRAAGAGRTVCVEPDPELLGQLEQRLRGLGSERHYLAICGTARAISDRFDTVLYIDVLEHIEDDRGELRHAAGLLRPGGRLIVLSPAHPFLFSPFDRALGHWRRYTKRMLREIAPAELRLERMSYLDSAGLLASLGNRFVLRQSMPTGAQLRFWDRWMIPVSRVIDRATFYSLGKTVLGVWSKPGSPAMSERD